MLVGMGVKREEILGDSKLVVQQITGDSQCMDGVLNEYRETCMDLLDQLDKFVIKHVPWEDNMKANMLAQQASGYVIRHRKFEVKREPASRAMANAIVSNDESAMKDGPTRDD
jgi:ribonuclease HI